MNWCGCWRLICEIPMLRGVNSVKTDIDANCRDMYELSMTRCFPGVSRHLVKTESCVNDRKFDVSIRLVGESEPHSLYVVSICWERDCCLENYKDSSFSLDFLLFSHPLSFLCFYYRWNYRWCIYRCRDADFY